MADSMRIRFTEELNKLIERKGKNNRLFTIDQYHSLMMKVKEAKNKFAKKTPEDYQRLARYDIVKIGNSERLIVPVKNETESVVFYAYLEETFQIIHDCHLNIGHGGRIRMMKEMKKKYKNVTAELVTLYLNLCESCQEKKGLPKKGLVIKPILCEEFNSRCQIDLIDMQSQADRDYKFIMVYQDHLTKFVQLRALKSNSAKEVASKLLDIFTIFGAPCVLQSENGREFVNRIVEEVCAMWPEIKIVHGEPRYSQAQVSAERVNQDVEKMLYTWLESNNTTKWSEGLRFIQFMKNRAHDSGINRSSHEAMFGCKAKIGINLPLESLNNVKTEEDLEIILNEGDENEEAKFHDEVDNYSNQVEDESQAEEAASTEEDDQIDNQTIYITQSQNEAILMSQEEQDIQDIRVSTREALRQQANKMLIQSSVKYPVANVGDIVAVKISDVDRAEADDRNIIAVIMAIDKDGMYRLGTKHGILNQLFTRNQFTHCKETYISVNEVPGEHLSILECARKESHLGGQGFQYCSCTGAGCSSNRCNDENCRRRWGNIRDQFKKTLNKRKRRSGQRSRALKKYRFEDILQFLLPYIQTQDTNIEDKDEAEVDEKMNIDEVKLLPACSAPIEESIDLPPSPPTTLTQPIDCFIPASSQLSSSSTKSTTIHKRQDRNASASNTLIKYIIEKNGKSKNDSDPIDAFFQGLIPTVKRFSPYYQHLAKGRIFAVVQELEFAQLHPPGSTSKLNVSSTSSTSTPCNTTLNTPDAP